MCNNPILSNRLNSSSSLEVFENLIKKDEWQILIRMFRLNILNINQRDSRGRNALYFAISKCKYCYIKDLVDLNVSKFVTPNLLALNFAISFDDTKAIDELLKAGLYIDEADEIGSTPLIYAILFAKQKSINYLLRNGSNIEFEDFMGNCARNLLKIV